MRSYTVLSLIIGNVALFAAPRQHSQTELDFNFGWAVGECLVAKCQIFRGAVTEPASQGATSVLVRADESIYGPSVDGQSVSVPYLANPGRPAKDGVHHLEEVWGRFAISANAPITVVRVLNRFLDIPGGNPVIVTADDREISLVRSLADASKRLSAAPASIQEMVDSLSTPNPALAGYLDAYLFFGNGRNSADAEADIRMRVLRSPSLPVSRKASLAIRMASEYSRMSATQRSVMVKSLTELVQRFMLSKREEDGPLALAAYAGLVKIWAIDPAAKAPQEPPALNALAVAYAGGVRAQTFGRTQLLETELHIDSNFLRIPKR